jgi:DNA-binding HxlR family transcriptional regulator
MPKSPKPVTQSKARSQCPINLVLERIGDGWTLLILRDMVFKGHRSYQAFLKSGEGIATNILADRLVKMEAHGLISKTKDTHDARKFIYAPTALGADMAQLLVDMAVLGASLTRRPDFPKEVLDSMRRNPGQYASKLMRLHRPKAPTKIRRSKKAPSDETLNWLELL